MSKYRYYTNSDMHIIQHKRWWGWKTIYKSPYLNTALTVLEQLREEEDV